MNSDIAAYNDLMRPDHRAIADAVAPLIAQSLPQAEVKVWHRTAVWFIAGNPIVGYASRRMGLQLLFWSGQSFDEPGLRATGSFKAAELYLTDAMNINTDELSRWLAKATTIQWDYKNIVKRKGVLEKIGKW